MWSKVSCRCWRLPEKILGDLSFGRVCGFFLVCSMPGLVEIQSGSNRIQLGSSPASVGIQLGSSRDLVVNCENSLGRVYN